MDGIKKESNCSSKSDLSLFGHDYTQFVADDKLPKNNIGNEGYMCPTKQIFCRIFKMS